MARFIQTSNPIKAVSMSASVDYKAVGETGKGYTSITEAKEYLGENGVDCIVAGLHFFIRKTDGSVSEYVFTDDVGTCVELANNGPITNIEIEKIINN